MSDPGVTEDLAAADLLLVRHARPVLRSGVMASQWRLDPAAKSECEALAAEVDRLLAGTGRVVTHLWSSAEPKAVGTAEAMAPGWGLDVQVHEGLGEHRRGPLPLVGDLEWRSSIADMFDRPDEVVLGLESATQAGARFEAAVRDVLDAAGEGRLSAVVTHATVMTLLLADANGVVPMTFWGSLAMPDAVLVDSRRGFRILWRAWRGRP